MSELDTIQAKPQHRTVSLGELDTVAIGYKLPDSDVPLFIEMRDGVFEDAQAYTDWVQSNRDRLDALLLEHGALVLRGFPVKTASDFDAFIGTFPAFESGYVGGMSPREKVTGKVMEATRTRPNYKIPLHLEMSYMKQYPARLAFFCRVPADEGGETIIGSMHEFMRKLPTALRAKLEGHDIHVVRNYAPAGNSRGKTAVDFSENIGWDSAFQTDDPKEVEAHCQRLGMEALWNEDESLTLLEVTKPFTTHPATGFVVYRNLLHMYLNADRQGLGEERQAMLRQQKRPIGHFLDNGETLSPEDAETVHRLLEEIEVAWPWRSGDIMLVDNLQVAHGRNPFPGGARDVMVGLLA